MLTGKKGMSARQLWRYMGFGSLKTAWYMAHRIRTAAVSKFEAENFVREVVSTNVSLAATDGALVYDDLKGFNHERVHHAAKRYVAGEVHMNTIEGFWSAFKGSIVGSYYKVSRKHLPLYIAECQFKYNNSFNDDIFGTSIKGC
jgi:hypothetical protein